MHWSIDVMRDFFPKCNRIETNSRGNCKTSQSRWMSLLESKIANFKTCLLHNILSISYITFCSWLPRMPFCKTSQSRWTILLECETSFTLIWWKEQDLTCLSFSSWLPRRLFWKGRGRWLERPKRSSKKLGSLTKKVKYIFDTRIISLIAFTKYTVQNTTWQVLIRWKWKYKKQNWRFDRFLRI